ncbi:hypothetical protein K438DRAFT_1771528 [Mycena galopus ATCC 62051]|nr:hypothetical protein K438DRAFT_1771528 [Mycena galopus ATCC 62051]
MLWSVVCLPLAYGILGFDERGFNRIRQYYALLARRGKLIIMAINLAIEDGERRYRNGTISSARPSWRGILVCTSLGAEYRARESGSRQKTLNIFKCNYGFPSIPVIFASRDVAACYALYRAAAGFLAEGQGGAVADSTVGDTVGVVSVLTRRDSGWLGDEVFWSKEKQALFAAHPVVSSLACCAHGTRKPRLTARMGHESGRVAWYVQYVYSSRKGRDRNRGKSYLEGPVYRRVRDGERQGGAHASRFLLERG